MAINLFKKRSEANVLSGELKRGVEGKEQEKPRSQSKRAVLLPGAQSVLLHPHITEKAGILSEKGQYVFQVSPSTTKHQVKSAVEHLYNIHVENIHMVTTRPKMRRDRKSGRRRFAERVEKKAIVSLKKGEKLELLPR